MVIDFQVALCKKWQWDRHFAMKPEEKARQQIDRLLKSAGWTVQDYQELHLSASLGVAVREFPMAEGFADYLLFVGGKAVGVVEAGV